MLQLFSARVRALERGIPGVVGELHCVDEVGVEAERLEGEYGGAVANTSWREV